MKTDSLSQNCLQNGTLISCRGQNLTTLPTDLPVNMTELDFGFNKLDVLSRNMFYQYPNLEKLRLNNNIINKISGLAFHGLIKLRLLNISFNRIGDHSMNDAAFQHITHLSILGIQDNVYHNYTAVHIPVLSGLRHLEIDVFDNFKFDESFLTFQKLETIQINPRSHFYINNDSFICFNNFCIKTLDLYFPHKVMRPIGEDYLRPFHRLKNLLIRFGQYAGIKDVLRSLFGLSHRNLSSLNLASNVLSPPLSQILTDKDLAALGNICVKRLDLSRNEITSIQSYYFWNSTASRCVEELNMAENNMIVWNALPFFYMANFANIKVLNIGRTPCGPIEQECQTGGKRYSFLDFKNVVNFTFRLSESLHTLNSVGFSAQLESFWKINNITYLAKILNS